LDDSNVTSQNLRDVSNDIHIEYSHKLLEFRPHGSIFLPWFLQFLDVFRWENEENDQPRTFRSSSKCASASEGYFSVVI
jgi:hypothetical protein